MNNTADGQIYNLIESNAKIMLEDYQEIPASKRVLGQRVLGFGKVSGTIFDFFESQDVPTTLDEKIAT